MFCKWTTQLGAVIVASGVLLGSTPVDAATLTWDAGGDGHSWNDAANWDNAGVDQAPGLSDTLHITTTNIVDNVYRSAADELYMHGSTWQGIANLNQGTINLPSFFGSGSNGVFNIGDATLTAGARDARVNVGGEWMFNRHGDGTFTVNVRSDGWLQGGTFATFTGQSPRRYVINVDGGVMVSPSGLVFDDGTTTDINEINISSGGVVSVGPLTVGNEVVDFVDGSGSLTAGYGGSFADIAAVNAAMGTTFVSSGGQLPQAIDNGNGTFTIADAASLVPPTGNAAPGGFIDEISNPILYHLDAAKGVSTSGALVTAWADQGVLGNNFVQAAANRQPLAGQATLGGNSLPAILFDGSNPNADRLVLDLPTSPQMVIAVNNTLSHTDLNGIWGRYSADNGIRRANSSAWNASNSGDFAYSGNTFVNGADTEQAGTGKPHILAVTGDQSYPATSIGHYFYNESRGWNGALGEVMAFGRQLVDSERQIIENHLSAKYDITLAENDHYAGDNPAQGDYDLDVIGIGRVGQTDFVRTAGAQGFGFAAGDLENGEWLMAGHKSPTNQWVSDDLPQEADARWARAWYLDVTGEFDATLAFNFDDAGLAAPSPEKPLVLLYSQTNAFDFSILPGNPTVQDGTVLFDLSAAQLVDGYYTLATVPEPSATVLLVLGLIGLASGRSRRRGR